MVDVRAILGGEADFPVVGATDEDCRSMFRQYALLCGGAREIIAENNDLEDYDQIRERADAVSALLPAMKAMSAMMLSQPTKLMLQMFAEEFMTDVDCLHFMEVMRANTNIDAFLNRVEKVWG